MMYRVMKSPPKNHLAKLQTLFLTPYEAKTTVRKVFKKTGINNKISNAKKPSKNTTFSAQQFNKEQPSIILPINLGLGIKKHNNTSGAVKSEIGAVCKTSYPYS